ncbi:hypothetical protein [Bacillus toyonensis]|uniref:hypothetical protein n=1 Tax=Bacillus toyonensis TaxID=155322 RepID=UPI002E234AB6|nr:hypothetical protein [Bacillus toyonensis]
MKADKKILEMLEDMEMNVLDIGKVTNGNQAFICHFVGTKKIYKVIVNISRYYTHNLAYEDLIHLEDCNCDAYSLMVRDGHYKNEYILKENGGKY